MVITLQRKKCIGCNYCVEDAPDYFQMSKTDGKSVLLKSINKKGYYILRTQEDFGYASCLNAQESCPVNIISVNK